MKKPSSTHPGWAVRHRKPGTELRCIKGRYYLYGYKTVYDSGLKRARKISLGILGAISEKEGFKPSLKHLSRTSPAFKLAAPVVVKEFGVSKLVADKFAQYGQRLQKHFPDDWKYLVALAYCRFVYRCPLKSVVFRLQASYLPELLQLGAYNEKTASAVLNRVGGLPQSRHDYMRSFIKAGDYILMDGTHVLSHSRQMDYVKPGYNRQMEFDGQVNLLYIYSALQRMPVYYRLLPGNIRDVKAFKNTLGYAGIKKAVIVADKGFYSAKNIEHLLEENLSFVIPLKRDNPLIQYEVIADNTLKNKAAFFMHEKRPVWYLSTQHPAYTVHLFVDDALKLKEESDYLTRISNNPEAYTLEKYQEKRNHFGTIALLSGRELADAPEVYETYKGRLYIETMFDGMKNILDADHTYMQNQETLEGWMFVNHICLQWYQQLYTELKDKGLLKKISVNDYIQLLTDVRKVKINDDWHLNEFTNATKKLIAKLNIKI
jgi:Transposase DDE domain